MPEIPSRIYLAGMLDEGKKTILFVEDEIIFASSTSLALEGYGYSIIRAKGRGDALAAFEHNPEISLAIMDIELGPGVDGSEVAARLLELRDIPIVFFTNHTERDLVERATKVGAFGYLLKNSGIALLDASIRMAYRLFEKSRGVDELRMAKASLKESEDKFRNLVWDMQVGVLLQGPKAEILLSNPKALELLGLDEDQLLGKTSFDPDWNVIHEDGSPFPGPTHPVPRAIATAHPIQNVVMGVYRPRLGDRVWLSVDAVPQFDAAGGVRQVVCTFLDITQRRKAESELGDALKENVGLLRELEHRVKNSFNMISSMISSASNTASSTETLSILGDLDSRVRSISELYSLLYSSGSFSEVRLDEYCSKIAEPLVGLSSHVGLKLDLEGLVFPAKKAALVGLILTELVINAMKYAFPGGRPGSIGVILKKRSKGGFLEVCDDGAGLPPGFDPSASPGMGLRLVSAISEQLGGEFRLERGEGGARCIVEFDVLAGEG